MIKGYDPIKAERYFENYGYEDIEKIEREREEKEEFLANYCTRKED